MNKFKILIVVILVVFSLSSCKSVNNVVEQEKTNNNDIGIFAEQVTPNYQVIGENKIALSSFNFELPDDLSLLSNTVNPIAENSDGTFQIMIEDKTRLVDDYNEYIKRTHSRYKALGMDVSEIQSIDNERIPANRFFLNTKDEKNEDVFMFFYFIEQDDLKIDVFVMLNGNETVNCFEIDNYVASINFSKN